MSRVRTLLQPRWLLGHVVVLALCVTMVLLGRWQLDVSNSKHFDLQNFGYTIQWWAFTLFALVMWIRVLRDVGRRDLKSEARDAADRAAALPGGVTYLRYLMPQNSLGGSIADARTDNQLTAPKQAESKQGQAIAPADRDGS